MQETPKPREPSTVEKAQAAARKAYEEQQERISFIERTQTVMHEGRNAYAGLTEVAQLRREPDMRAKMLEAADAYEAVAKTLREIAQ